MANSASMDTTRLQFEREIMPHYEAAYAFAYSFVQDDAKAKDLVQETYAKAIANSKGYVFGTNPKAWLFTILRNTFINDYRKNQKTPKSSSIDDILFSPADAEDNTPRAFNDLRVEMFDSMLDDGIVNALNVLSVGQRTIIMLAFVDDFSYEEIAAVLGIEIGTVRSRLHRARHTMKSLLIDYAQQKGYVS